MNAHVHFVLGSKGKHMLKLHGFVISNFYCIARQALLEKGIAFEAVEVMPNQETAYLAKSPMGKIPMLETEAGCLSETNVILDYLEEVYPDPALYPADPFARARMRQLIKMVELYLETPAHAMVNALFGAEVPQHQRDAGQPMMRRGLAALRQLAQFSPWLCGERFTAADVFTYHALSVVTAIGGKLYDWDVIAEVPGLQEWHRRVGERPITRQIDAETQAALRAFTQQQRG
jgi:glutathione S-transferase